MHTFERFAAQRKFAEETLPSSEEKAALYKFAVNSFTNIGYEMIGLDHFALSKDSLAIAKNKGELHRNFQGIPYVATPTLWGSAYQPLAP